MTVEPRRQGIVPVSVDLLLELLHMPADTTALSAELNHWSHSIDLLVESPDLPDIGTGGIPVLTPTVTRHAERFEWNWTSRDKEPT